MTTAHYVASPTLGPKGSAALFSLPDLGRFSTTCRGAGRARVAYRVASNTASQLVTAGGRPGQRWLNPGERIAIDVRGRSDWQVARLSEGVIQVATASFTAGRLSGGPGCFVSAKADVSRRRR